MLVNQDQAILQNDTTAHGGAEAIQDDPDCKALGLYLHIPYCTVKCPYCDFYTYPASALPESDRYVQAISEELQSHKGKKPLQTIFIGGGTPSLLSPKQLERLLVTIQGTFDVVSNPEVTLEINPENVTKENAKAWQKLGINRASVGVQSLDDAALARLKRTHKGADSRKAFQHLRSAGFENISLDLLFGLENQTPLDWEETLKKVLTWDPEHISAYSLTIEEKTRFAVDLKQKKLHLPTEDDQVAMFLRTPEILSEAGFNPYEISNFAKLGFESRHNLIYWTGRNYLGAGVSAHSFQRGEKIQRWWNIRSLPKYLAAMEKDGDATEEREELSAETHWNERLMTGLRLTRGVDLRSLAKDLGVNVPEKLHQTVNRFVESGHMEQAETRIRLTSRGAVVSDEIFSELT